jgi:3'-phosphoadenosine 5'-phosphosulfate (PAPS) 3'-phosphatase
MRGTSTKQMIPVTEEPYPLAVREAIHQLVREGRSMGRVWITDNADGTTSYDIFHSADGWTTVVA